MNITQEKIDELNSTLKIEITTEDYQDKVDKILRENQKKMNLPGFRPGKIPTSVVKKMYGKAILVDEINKIVIDSMYDYFGQNNIVILGNPLPNKEKSKEINWDVQTNFDFHFDVGLSPQFEVEPLDKLQVNYYDISVNDQVVDKYLNDLRKRFGKFSSPEISADGDLVYAEFEELDENENIKENGAKNKGSVAIDLIKNSAIKKNFIGLKKDDSINIDLFKTFESQVEISHLLGIEKSKVSELNNLFKVNVLNISRVELAQIDNEFFEKVYKSDNITTEEQLKDKIKQDAQISFSTESDRKFVSDTVNLLIKNTQIALPEAFLKRWLLETNRDKFTEEQVETEFSIYSDSLKWQLIENKILKQHNIEVTNEDIKNYIKDYFRKSMNQGGGAEFPDDRLDELAERFLQNKEETKKIYDQLYDEKIKNLFISNIKMKKEEVSYEEFVKLASEKQENI